MTSVPLIPSAETPGRCVDSVHPESDPSSQQECLECLLEEDPCESSDLQHMFYPPQQIRPKRCHHSLPSKAFQTIPANVRELLSRSPPPLSLLPDQLLPAALPAAGADPGSLSPGWDLLFDDDGFTEERPEERLEERPEERMEQRESLDESIDLFGDDEAFLQLSVPEVRTPDKSAGPDGKQQTPDTGSHTPFNCSQDFFSVNFDLEFESEEEECADTASALRPVGGDGRSDPRPSASTPTRVFPPPERHTPPSCSRETPSQRRPPLQRRSCAGVLGSDREGQTPLKTLAPEANPVFSPEQSKICSDVDSPVQARRKRSAALNTSEESDGDFQDVTLHQPRDMKPRHRRKPHKVLGREGRQFLDEEAELSADEEVSSDEEDEEEQNHSLQGFVLNSSQCSQGLNDSEMQAFYLRSVRSPALQNRLRLTLKPRRSVDIFSQVPEQDETYAEDSFVVAGSAEEESGGEEEPVELIADDSYVDGRKQYATRRRVRIRNATGRVQPGRSKRSRILRLRDSSEEEEEEEEGRESVFKVPPCLQSGSRRQRLSGRAEEPEQQVSVRSPAAAGAALSVLVDSRCISGGSEVVSCLRLRHGMQVHVCSLGSADFIVSNRMAVDWQSESEVAGAQNRQRLQERIQRLLATYERVCLILQSDRSKPGEAARAFQRSRYYDGTLAALVKAGVRLLVSNGPEDTAALLSELTQVESRKGQAIDVPLEVKGHRQAALQFCLALPHVSYINALNMCHRFRSVAHMVRSSVDELQASAQTSRSRAQHMHRCLRYCCC